MSDEFRNLDDDDGLPPPDNGNYGRVSEPNTDEAEEEEEEEEEE